MMNRLQPCTDRFGNYLHCHIAKSVLPTGRNFGRKRQIWPEKNMSGRIFSVLLKTGRKEAGVFLIEFLTHNRRKKTFTGSLQLY
jgi:hypothetical protein